MIRLASLIEQFEQPVLAQYGDRLRPEQRQALAAMKSLIGGLRRTATPGRLSHVSEMCA